MVFIVGNCVLGGMWLLEEFVCYCVFDLVGDFVLVGVLLLVCVSVLWLSYEMNFWLVDVLLVEFDVW